MTEIFNSILLNLRNVGIGAVFFALAYSSNVLLSTFYNVKIIGSEFNKKTFIDGIIKLICFVFGTAFLSIALTGMPLFANYIGFAISDEYVEAFNSITIFSLFLYGTADYAKKSITKIKNIMAGGNENN